MCDYILKFRKKFHLSNTTFYKTLPQNLDIPIKNIIQRRIKYKKPQITWLSTIYWFRLSSFRDQKVKLNLLMLLYPFRIRFMHEIFVIQKGERVFWNFPSINNSITNENNTICSLQIYNINTIQCLTIAVKVRLHVHWIEFRLLF